MVSDYYHSFVHSRFSSRDQTWYADDAGAGGKFDAIKRHFEKLEEIGPNYGYFPSLRSILIVSQREHSSCAGSFEIITITTGRYLGGFIGERKLLISGFKKSR
jgi:hypothetical protein